MRILLGLALVTACNTPLLFADPAPHATKPTPSPPTTARTRISSERPKVRDGGGFAMTDAQREADPTGELIYPIVPLGSCDDPGSLVQQQTTENLPPYPAKPADPLHALAGDRPAALPIPVSRMDRASMHARSTPATCDAAHDHCFRDCTWIVTDKRMGVRVFDGYPSHLRPDGYWARPASTLRYTYDDGPLGQNLLPDADAYRTVPATKRLLAVGVTVAVHDAVPTSETEAFEVWRIGKVRELDWDAKTVKIAGSADAFPPAATRVAVMVSHATGPVTILDGRKREELAVTAAETFH